MYVAFIGKRTEICRDTENQPVEWHKCRIGSAPFGAQADEKPSQADVKSPLNEMVPNVHARLSRSLHMKMG